MSDALPVYVGYDGRESRAYAVCVRSLLDHASVRLDVRPLLQADLRAQGLYHRPERIDSTGQRWCLVSGAPCSTEFSNSRFFLRRLRGGGRAVFCDSDFLWRRDIADLVAGLEGDHALWCVKHRHEPTEEQKMRGQAQTRYDRKNWSSLMVWQLDHPAHELVAPVLDLWPGRTLHRLQWLVDDEIGDLSPGWNWLAEVEGQPPAGEMGPAAVHFTQGTPDMPGHETAPYAGEWWAVAQRMGLGPETVDQRRA